MIIKGIIISKKEIIINSSILVGSTYEGKLNWFVWGLIYIRFWVQFSWGVVEGGSHLWGEAFISLRGVKAS